MRRIAAITLLALLLAVGVAALGSAGPAVSASDPTLRRGATGARVREVQTMLIASGFNPGAVDGRFGPRTRRAVMNFQRAKQLGVDGIVGPRTWAALRSTTAPATTTSTTPSTSATGTTAAPTTTPAPPGSTPSGETWDRLAQCESNGRWNLNLGTGFYGGLQFTLAAWRGSGGTGHPHEATREQQIAIATVLWQARGWRPWPACSRRLGLS
jgi:peptidoglycan hydrolase-like protein with peptidoglycan-binding domain